MASCDYLGDLELDAAGNVRIRPVVIGPLPEREYRPVAVPTSVARRIDDGHAFAAPVVGDSMQPVILDNDTIIVSRVREPHTGDIVVVRATEPDPKFGELCGYVWRYHRRRSGVYVTKDNSKYGRDFRSIRREAIVGVVIRVIHREGRDMYENHIAVQKIVALHRSCKWGRPPADLGFHRDAKLAELRAILDISDSELIAGRLPWGLLRASAIADHAHAGILAADTLTVEITPESRVGLAVIVRNRAGETLLGMMQRDGLDTPAPGDFYLNVGDRRVALTREGGQVHLWQSMAVVRRVQRHVQNRDAAEEQLVHVSGYVKRDGTFVPPLDRPMPMNANQKWTPKSSSHRGELGFSIRHSPITP
jgi:hypothetical protein